MFRDSKGRVLFQFGKEVSVDLAVHTEVLTLREGLLMAAASRKASTHSFVFESNCQSVVAWVADPLSAAWNFHTTLRECCLVFGTEISWSPSHIDILENEATNVLARIGLDDINFIEFM